MLPTSTSVGDGRRVLSPRRQTGSNTGESPVSIETPVVEAPVTVIAPKTLKVAKTKAPAKPKTTVKKIEGKKGLSGSQIRILKVLVKASGPMTRADISKKTEIDTAAVGNQIGYVDAEINARPVHAHNLLNRKFVRFGNNEDKPGVVYEITAAGRKAIESVK